MKTVDLIWSRKFVEINMKTGISNNRPLCISLCRHVKNIFTVKKNITIRGHVYS